ncbi:hypothetical protein niasHS_003672 [Heterodera schachtii]|uniref:Uncharacterized protein n=1 Tax=Heterodera schachtii TaxID=97005 RepID=A0ABD2KHN3_HETSC
MSLVVVKVNDQPCRAVIATNFTHSFCGSGLVNSLKLKVIDLNDAPTVSTSEGTPIEFLGQALVQLEFGPWHSDGFTPLLIAYDCPADMLIGQDLINEISATMPIKFEYHKSSVNVGGTRVSMLDPMAAEEKFFSVRVVDPRNNEEIGLETWKKGARESIEMGGMVKRRVEVTRGPSDEKEEGEEEKEKEGIEKEQKEEEEREEKSYYEQKEGEDERKEEDDMNEKEDERNAEEDERKEEDDRNEEEDERKEEAERKE